MTAAKIGAACLAALSLPAGAQSRYPSRLITVVAPISPGTAIDILARLYAEKLSSKFGWQVVVEDRPGAAGAVGGEYVSRAAADGYTLIFANSGLTFLKYTNRNLKFDPLKSFSGVAIVGQAPRMSNLGLVAQDQGPDAFDVTIRRQITELTPVLTGIAKGVSQN